MVHIMFDTRIARFSKFHHFLRHISPENVITQPNNQPVWPSLHDTCLVKWFVQINHTHSKPLILCFITGHSESLWQFYVIFIGIRLNWGQYHYSKVWIHNRWKRYWCSIDCISIDCISIDCISIVWDTFLHLCYLIMSILC